MAGFATGHDAIRAALPHSFVELSFVRIQMATCTSQFIPVVHSCLWPEAVTLLMAIAADYCHMATSQYELGVFVSRQ